MNIKKKVRNSWSLDAKDNYDLIKERVSFVDPQQHKKTLWFQGGIFAVASIVFVIFVLSISTNLFFQKNKTDMPEPNGGYNENNKPNDNPSSEPIPDIDSIIQGGSIISKPFIDIEKVKELEFTDVMGVTVVVEDASAIVKFLNDLEYTKEVVDEGLSLENSVVFKDKCVLDFNNGSLKIYFKNNNDIIIKTNATLYHFTTNNDNLEKSIKNILK